MYEMSHNNLVGTHRYACPSAGWELGEFHLTIEKQ